MRLDVDQVESHVCPGELSELETVMPLFEGADENNKTHNIKHETDEAMVGSEYYQYPIDEDYMFEIIYHALAV